LLYLENPTTAKAKEERAETVCPALYSYLF
jgi:hypothetical protein